MKRIVRAPRGLTLVELLGALAIAGLLMVPLADLFQDAANSSVTGRAALDLNADLRFALDRVAATAAATAPQQAPLNNGADVTDASTWLAPLSYTLSGTSLVETDSSVSPARTSVIAANVAAFQLTAPAVGAGQPLMKIDLTLSAAGASVRGVRFVRLGGTL